MASSKRKLPEREIYKGVVMYTKMHEELDNVETMDIRSDDIWVCSFPRSGTTMTQELVYLVQTLDFDAARTVSQEERFPQLLEHAEENVENVTTLKDLTGLKNHEMRKSPRMIKSHLHHFLLPQQLRDGKGRVIYICRNPKDVAVSYYRLMDYIKLLDKEFVTFDSFIDCFVKGIELYRCPWQKHVIEYWEHKHDSNILFLRYEDVVEDMPAEIRRIAKFLERELTDDDVAKIADHCYVDSMRSNSMINWDCWKGIKDLNQNADSAFINKGRPGVWRDILTMEQSEKIDLMLQEVGKVGLEFRHAS